MAAPSTHDSDAMLAGSNRATVGCSERAADLSGPSRGNPVRPDGTQVDLRGGRRD